MFSDEDYISTPLEIEKELTDFFSLKKPKVIFDIGSCDGLDSIKYAQKFQNALIYSFEPILKNIDLINTNILKYDIKNIIIECFAFSNKKGNAIFHLSSGKPEEFSNSNWDFGNKSSSLLEPNLTMEVLPWLEFNESIEVETNTIDNYCTNKDIKNIDFIHMDVQGAELMVLEGAKSKINKIKMIWLEVEKIELYKNQPLKNDVENFLMKNGFTKIKDTVNHISGDQLWVNYSFFPRKLFTHILYLFFNKFISFLNKKK
jgi:FkbM family methyltransferase